MAAERGNPGERTRIGRSELAPLADSALIGTQLAGYAIEDVAGSGGMGVVYRAKHLHLDRVVALKVLASELADRPDFRERFLREARTAAAIHHPNIVTVHDAGEAHGRLYIAMQYIEGTDLAELVRQEGALEPERALALLGEVAAALDAAHARGVVHRDVKPANVLVQSGRCYLTDFGLTKAISSTGALTKRGEFIGTVDYMAPEQIQGQAVDGRTDVYALGCLAYQLLSSRLPFERDSEVAVVHAHLRDQAPALTEVRPDLPTGFDGVLARAMAKRMEDRHASCGELVDGLRRALDGMPGEGVEGGPRLVKLMVVAEEPRTRAVVRASVEGRPLQLFEAASVESALAVVRKEAPDVALVDCDGREGFATEVYGALREECAPGELKIIAIEERGPSAATHLAGADGVLVKPFSPLQLLYRIQDLLGESFA